MNETVNILTFQVIRNYDYNICNMIDFNHSNYRKASLQSYKVRLNPILHGSSMHALFTALTAHRVENRGILFKPKKGYGILRY